MHSEKFKIFNLDIIYFRATELIENIILLKTVHFLLSLLLQFDFTTKNIYNRKKNSFLAQKMAKKFIFDPRPWPLCKNYFVLHFSGPIIDFHKIWPKKVVKWRSRRSVKCEMSQVWGVRQGLRPDWLRSIGCVRPFSKGSFYTFKGKKYFFSKSFLIMV